jgi:hypothetical protein
VGVPPPAAAMDELQPFPPLSWGQPLHPNAWADTFRKATAARAIKNVRSLRIVGSLNCEIFNRSLTFWVRHPAGGIIEPRDTMDDISWTDLDADEQRALAMLSVGFSAELCGSVTLLTLKRIGLIKGSRLTLEAEQLISAAVRREFAA